MAAHSGSSSSVPSLPPPCPKSPPEYPDLYGKRRELAKVQVLEREISFLEEELKTVDRFHPASRSCKEVADFVVAKSDPLIPVGTPCFNFSWLSWICCCCYSKCSIHIELPRCCDCSDCSICCCRPCTCCSIPKCWCWSCPKSCPRSRCCRKVSCSRDCCCIFRLPSCLDCSCCCQWKCPSLKCPKVPLHCSCRSNCLHCSCKRNCCTCNPCSLFF